MVQKTLQRTTIQEQFGDDYVCQHDEAPYHKAKVITTVSVSGNKTLNTVFWVHGQEKSSDLNPIEMILPQGVGGQTKTHKSIDYVRIMRHHSGS